MLSLDFPLSQSVIENEAFFIFLQLFLWKHLILVELLLQLWEEFIWVQRYVCKLLLHLLDWYILPGFCRFHWLFKHFYLFRSRLFGGLAGHWAFKLIFLKLACDLTALIHLIEWVLDLVQLILLASSHCKRYLSSLLLHNTWVKLGHAILKIFLLLGCFFWWILKTGHLCALLGHPERGLIGLQGLWLEGCVSHLILGINDIYWVAFRILRLLS